MVVTINHVALLFRKRNMTQTFYCEISIKLHEKVSNMSAMGFLGCRIQNGAKATHTRGDFALVVCTMLDNPSSYFLKFHRNRTHFPNGFFNVENYFKQFRIVYEKLPHAVLTPKAVRGLFQKSAPLRESRFGWGFMKNILFRSHTTWPVFEWGPKHVCIVYLLWGIKERILIWKDSPHLQVRRWFHFCGINSPIKWAFGSSSDVNKIGIFHDFERDGLTTTGMASAAICMSLYQKLTLWTKSGDGVLEHSDP